MPSRRKSQLFTSEEFDVINNALVSVIRIQGQGTLVSTVGAILAPHVMHMLKKKRCKLLKFLDKYPETYSINGELGRQTLTINNLEKCALEEECTLINSVEDVLDEIRGICSSCSTRSILVSQLGAKISVSSRAFLKSKKLRIMTVLEISDDFNISGTSGEELVKLVSNSGPHVHFLPTPERVSSTPKERSVRIAEPVKISAISKSTAWTGSDTDAHSDVVEQVSAFDSLSPQSSKVVQPSRNLTHKDVLQHVMQCYDSVGDLNRDLIISTPLYYMD